MTLVLILFTFTLALAGAVKGLFGMGLPTVSMGLLGLVMSPLQAATLSVVPTLLSNVWQLTVGPSLRPLAVRFAWLMMTMVIGTTIGISFLTSTSPLAD